MNQPHSDRNEQCCTLSGCLYVGGFRFPGLRYASPRAVTLRPFRARNRI